MTPTQSLIVGQAQRLIPEVMDLYDRALALEQSYAESLQKVGLGYRDSARNLLHYLAVRQVDVRQLQIALAALGLSSLGRMESHTLSTLQAVLFALSRIANQSWTPQAKPPVNFHTGQMLLAAGPQTPFKSVRDVIAYAKQNPGKLNYASSGNGTPGHVGMELFKFMSGIQVVHVPYKGGAAGITDLIAGQVQIMLESTNSITPHARAGRVRGLAVTSAKRTEALPDRVLLYAHDGDAALEEVERRGFTPEGSLVRRSSLEDVFLRLTGRTLVE